MRKVKSILLTIVMFVSLEKLFRTMKSLKVINGIDDERNTTPMLASKDASLMSKFMEGLKVVFLGNDRTGKKKFGLLCTGSIAMMGYGEIRNGRLIILMSGTFNPIVTATINAPDDVEGKAKCGEKIRDKGAGTTYITINPTQLAALTPLIKSLRDAVGSAEVSYAWGQLNAALKEIMHLVQVCMNGQPDKAEIICEYYGFHVKGKGGDHEQVFSGESGVYVGEIDLVLPKGDNGCVYDIKLWNADRTLFTRAQPSDVTNVTIGSLVSGSNQNVSVAEIRHGKLVRESQIITVRVK